MSSKTFKPGMVVVMKRKTREIIDSELITDVSKATVERSVRRLQQRYPEPEFLIDDSELDIQLRAN